MFTQLVKKLGWTVKEKRMLWMGVEDGPDRGSSSEADDLKKMLDSALSSSEGLFDEPIDHKNALLTQEQIAARDAKEGLPQGEKNLGDAFAKFELSVDGVKALGEFKDVDDVRDANVLISDFFEKITDFLQMHASISAPSDGAEALFAKALKMATNVSLSLPSVYIDQMVSLSDLYDDADNAEQREEIEELYSDAQFSGEMARRDIETLMANPGSDAQEEMNKNVLAMLKGLMDESGKVTNEFWAKTEEFEEDEEGG